MNVLSIGRLVDVLLLQDESERFMGASCGPSELAGFGEGRKGVVVVATIIEILRPFGIIELVRTGAVAMLRGPGAGGQNGAARAEDGVAA